MLILNGLALLTSWETTAEQTVATGYSHNQINQGLGEGKEGVLGNFWPRSYDINLISKNAVADIQAVPNLQDYGHSICAIQELSPTGACVYPRWQSSGVRAFKGYTRIFFLFCDHLKLTVESGEGFTLSLC